MASLGRAARARDGRVERVSSERRREDVVG
jgi:hypothetical protein